MKRLVVLGAALLGMVACGGGGSSTSPSATPAPSVTIGVAVPLSGPNAALGQPIANAVQLAASLANQSGKLPGKVLVDVEDDQDQPAIGTSVGQRFCTSADIIGVVGDFGSSTVQSTQPIYNGCGLAQLAPAASLDSLTTHGYTNFFRTTPRNSSQSAESATWFFNTFPSVSVFGTIDANDATTSQLASQFSTAAQQKGLTSVGAVHVTSGDTDFRGPLTTLISKKPGVLYMALLFNDAALAVKQARELGYTGLILGISSDANAKFVSLAGASNAEGVYMTNLGYDPNHTPSAQSFVSAYQARYGQPPTTFGANAFDAANALIAAWKATGGSTDRSKIIAALHQVSIQGTQGTIAFDTNGDMKQVNIGVFEVKGGVVTYIGPAV